MAKKVAKWKKTARARKISKSLKAYYAKVRRIREREPHLTYKEAQERVRESFIETVRRSEESWHERFLTIDRAKDIYRRLDPEKPAKAIFTYGRDMSFIDVMRAKGVYVYWGMIKRMSNMLGLSLQKTRELFRDMREAMREAAKRVGKLRAFRTRDVAAVIEFSDRYPKVRLKYGI